MNNRLYTFLALGLLTGLIIGACSCMVMEQVLLLHPQETGILLACSGWCGIIFYSARLLYLVRRSLNNVSE